MQRSTAAIRVPERFAAASAVLLGAQILTAAAPAHAGRFEFDERRTEVRFHYVMAMSKQRGRFSKVSGTLDYDAAAPQKSKINASIATGSLTTGEVIIDEELKGKEFFNVAASPTITFKSRSVQSRSDTQADVAGDITVNGITKPVTLKVTLKPHDDPALKHDAGAHEFVAKTRIKRSDFKMTGWQALVDDDVEIEIAAIVRPARQVADPAASPQNAGSQKVLPAKKAAVQKKPATAKVGPSKVSPPKMGPQLPPQARAQPDPRVTGSTP